MVRNLRKRRLSSPSPSNRARPPPPSSAPPDTTEIAGPETITIAPDGDVTLILMRDVETLVTDNKVTQEVRIQVSSEKLSRASPVFKAMLRGNFREEVDLRSGGHVKIHLPDDDPDYFAVLLDAIHDRDGKCRQIPSLENLAGLCSLIDKYFLLEGVAQSLKYWLKKVKPKRFSDETELGKLIYIYWTTQRPKPLSSIMSQAVVWLRSPLTQDKFQFLVPTWIIG
ncbi:hypothetical protein PRK78_002094 [Emydomyces testavorans]|uniref:BTB domain-containing protein n=1 Tax=Emydomyces testavorans TaxID=2070801 RepID=A0AAF0DFE7_9EURO|nr:hypothetical protein PRK78_002094 [Emydomyces testavorans]